MIHARLAIFGRVDRVAFSIHDLATCFQMVELPSDKRIKVGIGVRGQERASPVDLTPLETGFKCVNFVQPHYIIIIFKLIILLLYAIDCKHLHAFRIRSSPDAQVEESTPTNKQDRQTF